jgi:choice-of-anchor A domain-containing protein
MFKELWQATEPLIGFRRAPWAASCGLLLLTVASSMVRADQSPFAYAVLYEGTGGHNLSITNVTINGNVGVGGTGAVKFSGPGKITGALDFLAANTGQYSNSNGSNVGPASVNYNVSDVTAALNNVNSLSTSLGSQTGTTTTLNGTTSISASNGTLYTHNGVNYRIFNVTTYSEGNGNVVTINGDAAHDTVVLNYAAGGNPQYGGDVTLNGLTGDQVIWNYTGTNNLSLNNNASSYPLPLAFQGDILAPNAAISLTNANLDGRVWGGDSSDMQIVSGTTINAPTPEPASLCLWLGVGAFSVVGYVRSRQRKLRADLR